MLKSDDNSLELLLNKLQNSRRSKTKASNLSELAQEINNISKNDYNSIQNTNTPQIQRAIQTQQNLHNMHMPRFKEQLSTITNLKSKSRMKSKQIPGLGVHYKNDISLENIMGMLESNKCKLIKLIKLLF